MTFALLFMTTLLSFGQKGVEDGSRYGHGEDSIRCLRNYSLYREYVKNDGYDDAIPFWRVVYSECPRVSKNVYIDGVEIYKYFIDNAESPELKDQYVDTLMMVYDTRIKYYDQKGFVLGRKGVDLLRFKRDAEAIEEAFGYLKESIELRKTNAEPAVLATYFTAAITLYKAGVIEDTEVVSIFSEHNKLLDAAIEKHGNNKRQVSALEKVQEISTRNFIRSGAATCESIIAEFKPKFEANQDNKEFLLNLTGMLSKLKCENSDLYAKASEKLYALEPSPGAAYKLAKMLVKKEEFNKASRYYNEAVNSEDNPDDKATYLYEHAIITAQLNDKVQARSYARKAVDLRPDWGEPYLFIGRLYANSSKECGADEFERNAVFWVAVDKFIKAKKVDSSVAATANELINQYSRYFPDKEEGFFRDIHEGDSYTVGCWINETTTVRY